MPKGEKCIISNCHNIISKGRKGLICGTHQYRKKQFNSYDLPGHIGKKNYPIIKKIPEGFVKLCIKHGYLTIDQTYKQYYKGLNNSFNCKECALSANIRRKYKGMENLDCYNSILKKQNGVCAMCFKENTVTRNGKIKRFAIDHCHKTKKVRGLLCGFCNAMLGYAKDSIETLESAIRYLKNKD